MNLINRLLLVALLAFSSVAASVDITVDDGTKFKKYGEDPRGIHESGYTSKGTVAAPKWDLRAFGYDNSTSTLTYIGGFNPIGKTEGFGFGDLFFDTDGVLNPPVRSNVDGYFQYNNPGFEYAIHITGETASGLNYDVYKLSGNSQVLTGYFALNSASDPYQLVVDSNSTLILSGFASVIPGVSNSVVNSQFYTDIGNNPGSNYLASFSTSFLDDPQFVVYLTIQCGNDLLVGKVVPEASAIGGCAAFLGIGAILSISRRKRS